MRCRGRCAMDAADDGTNGEALASDRTVVMPARARVAAGTGRDAVTTHRLTRSNAGSRGISARSPGIWCARRRDGPRPSRRCAKASPAISLRRPIGSASVGRADRRSTQSSMTSLAAVDRPSIPPSRSAAHGSASPRRPTVRPSPRASRPDAAARATQHPAAATGETAPGVAITAAQIERVERALTRALGPIAKVLVKRALPDAASEAALWDRLAAHIERPADREAFLRQRPGG